MILITQAETELEDLGASCITLGSTQNSGSEKSSMNILRCEPQGL